MKNPRKMQNAARDLVEAEDGTTLVEFAIVMPIFLLILFALIDFGRLGYEYVMAQKAMQMAARIAIVRVPACANVPVVNTPGAVPAGTSAPHYGTNCSTAATVCASPATVACDGSSANATSAEIWAAISPLMPSGSTQANLRFSYAFNSDFGFLGGPYVPMVTVQLQNLNFQFVSPLGALAALAGAVGGGLPQTLVFPTMSVSLPGEDLAAGVDG